MKIALVSLQAEAERVPPVGLICLATYLKEHEVKIFDANFDEDILKLILDFKPEVIGLSAMTVLYEKVTTFAKECKEKIPQAKIILGGPHISTLPSSFRKCFDIGVLGEGEETLKELLDKNFKDLSSIKSIIYWDKNEIKYTQKREPLILDNLPTPNFNLVNKRYFEKADIPSLGKAGVRGYIMSSRSCPYKCQFCSTSSFWGKLRLASPETLAKQVKKQIEEQGSDYFYVLDDLFALTPQRLGLIRDQFEKEGILDKISGLDSTCRANLMTDKMCEAMKAVKIKVLNFGFESGSQKVLNYLKAGGVTIEQNKNAIIMAHKHGFTITGSIMYGSPGETIADMKLTNDFIDFCAKNGAKHIWSFQATPFPQTDFWRIAKERGKVSDDMDFNLLNLHNYDTPLLLDPEIPREEFDKVFWESKKKLRNMRIKLVLKFGLKNPLIAIGMVLKEPSYWSKRLFKQLVKQ